MRASQLSLQAGFSGRNEQPFFFDDSLFKATGLPSPSSLGVPVEVVVRVPKK